MPKLHFCFVRNGKIGATLKIGESKQFEDNRLTLKTNTQNFKGAYRLSGMLNRDVARRGNPIVIKITDLDTDREYAKVQASFTDKVL